MADDLGTQLQIQQQINKALQDRNALLAANEKSLQNQVQVAINLCKALKCEDLEALEEGMKGVNEQFKQVAANAPMAGSAMEAAANQGAEAATRANDQLKKQNSLLTAGKGAALGLAGGLISGFKGAFGMVKNLGKGLFGIIGTLGKVGKSIISLPFKLMGGLIGMAQSGGGGGPSPIRVELENIRKEFGSLASNEGKAAASSLGQFKAQAGNLAGTGLSLAKVFGRGPGGVAKAMAYNLETMKALGPAAANLSDVFQESAVELAMYRKGLGLAADEMASLLKHADAAGKDPVDAMREFSSMAIQMGDQFGISGKTVSKAMATMAKDVANFGNLSVKELGQAAVYTAKLGIEVKELQGLVAKFDNFEDAAKGAAHLSQAFGMNVDAIKMMNAQNPAERLSMLQKSFKATGKSVENMTRQELKLLASQAGLSEEAAKMAFSQKGLSMSYEDVQKAGAKNEKKQLSQAEAMDKLAGSIERVFGGGGGGKKFKGFFDAFVQGFARGVKRSKEFRRVMKNIRKSLKVVYKGGQEIGKMFVKMFPGVKQMLGGLGDLFDPKRYKALMKDVKRVFKTFFGDLQNDPEAGVKTFFKNMKEVFKKFFKSGGEGSKQVMSGGKMFLKALGGIFKGLLTMAVEGLAKIFDKIANALANPPKVPTAMGKAFKKLGKAAGKLLGELWKILKPPLVRMLTKMFEAAKPMVMKAAGVILKGMLIKIVLTAGASALKGAVVGKLGGMLKGMFSKSFGQASGALEKAAGPAGQIGKGLKKGMGPMSEKLGAFLKTMADIGIGDMIKAAFKITVMATVFFPALMILAVAMKVIGSMFSMKEAITAGIAMVSIGIAIFSMGKAIEAGAKINVGKVGKAIIGTIGAALLVTTGGVAFAMALHMIAPFFRGLDWKGIALGFIALAVTLAATAASIYVMSLIPTPIITLAATNTAMAGLFVLALGVFSLAMMIAAIPIMRTPWESLVKPLGAIALSMVILAATALASLAVGALSIQASIALGVSLVFITALGLFSLLMEQVAPTMIKLVGPMVQVGKYFGITALALGAMILTQLAAIQGGALAVPATLGIVLLTAFVGAMTYVFIPVLKTFAKKAGGLDFKKLALDMLCFAGVVGGLTLGAMALAAAVPAIAMGIVAIALLSAFVFVTSEVFLPALNNLVTSMPEDMKGLAKKMGFFVLVAGALAVVAVAMAVGVAAFLIGILGVMAMGAFVSVFNEDGIPPLTELATAIGTNAATFKSAEPGLKALGKLMTVLSDTASLAKSLMVFKLPFIGSLMMGGLEMIGTFVTQIKTHVIPAVKTIAGMKIESAGDLTAKIEAIGGVVKMISDLGGVAIALADADTSAMEEGGTQGAAMSAAGTFVETLFKGVKEIIDKITGIDMDPAQIRAAAAVGKVLGAIGTMMQALAPDPKLIKSLQTTTKSSLGPFSRTKTKTNTKAISAVADYLKTVMGTIATQIPIMIGAIMTAAGKVGNAKAAGAKIDVVAKAFKIIGELAGAIKDVMGVIPKVKGGDANAQAEAVRTTINTVSDVLFGSDGGTPGALGKAFAGLKAIIASVTGAEAFGKKVDAVAKAFGIIGSFADAIAKIAGMMPKKDAAGKAIGVDESLKILLGPNGIVTKIVDALSGDTGMLAKVFGTLKGLVDSLPETGGKAFMEKVKAVGDMFGIVGSFANAIGKVSGLMTVPEGAAPDATLLMDYVGTIVEKLAGKGGAIEKLAAGLLELVKKDEVVQLIEQRNNLKKLGESFGVVGKFAEAMSALSSVGGGGDASAVTTRISELSIIFTSATMGKITSIFENLAVLSKNVSGMKFNKAKMDAASGFVTSVAGALSNMDAIPAQIADKVEAINVGMANLSAILTNAASDPDMALAVKIGEGLAGDGTVTVQHENVNITVNLQVQMDAASIAKGTIKALGAVNGQPGYKVFAANGE